MSETIGAGQGFRLTGSLLAGSIFFIVIRYVWLANCE